MSWARITRMAIKRSTMLLSVSLRISHRAIPSLKGRGILAISTVIFPQLMRYTEARLTEVARLLLDGLTEED